MRLLSFVLAALLFIPCSFVQAQKRNVVVLVIPGLKASDLRRPELSSLRTFAANSAIGWMNTRTARVAGQAKDPEEAAYVTLGSGSRAKAGAYARVVNAETLNRLQRENAELDHSVHVGLLGDLLRSAGMDSQVSGDEDDIAPKRSAGWIVTDSRGAVTLDPIPTGNRNLYWEDPYGIRQHLTDFHRVWEHGQGVFVYVYGDVARADRYADLCFPKVADLHRKQALERVDSNIGNIISPDLTARLPDTLILLLAPCPADSAAPGDRLAPIIMHRPGVRPGLIAGGSTRVPGLVTNTDFLPTIAEWLRLKSPKNLVGRPMYVVPRPPIDSGGGWFERLLVSLRLRPSPDRKQMDVADQWANMHDQWLETAEQQAAFGGLPTLQLIMVVVCMVALAMGGRWRKLAGLGVIVPAIPVACLFLPKLGFRSLLMAGIALAVVLLAIGVYSVWRLNGGGAIIKWLCGILVGALAIDLLTGGYLLRKSWMSYSVMEGARYYGIGNESEGAAVGAMMIVAATLASVGRTRWATAAAMAGLAILIGLPAFGAKFGGMIGALTASGVAAMVWWRGRIRVGDLLILILIIGTALGLLVAVDLLRDAAAQSHIGRSIAGADIANIAFRKLKLNFYLLTHSVWSLCLIGSAGATYLLWRWGLGVIVRSDRTLLGAAAGIAAGSAALFIVNDSGVLAAAECLLLAWAAGLQLMVRGAYCEERADSVGTQQIASLR